MNELPFLYIANRFCAVYAISASYCKTAVMVDDDQAAMLRASMKTVCFVVG